MIASLDVLHLTESHAFQEVADNVAGRSSDVPRLSGWSAVSTWNVTDVPLPG